jgi:hypothetical protein
MQSIQIQHQRGGASKSKVACSQSEGEPPFELMRQKNNCADGAQLPVRGLRNGGDEIV